MYFFAAFVFFELFMRYLIVFTAKTFNLDILVLKYAFYYFCRCGL